MEHTHTYETFSCEPVSIMGYVKLMEHTHLQFVSLVVFLESPPSPKLHYGM